MFAQLRTGLSKAFLESRVNIYLEGQLQRLFHVPVNFP